MSVKGKLFSDADNRFYELTVLIYSVCLWGSLVNLKWNEKNLVTSCEQIYSFLELKYATFNKLYPSKWGLTLFSVGLIFLLPQFHEFMIYQIFEIVR